MRAGLHISMIEMRITCTWLTVLLSFRIREDSSLLCSCSAMLTGMAYCSLQYCRFVSRYCFCNCGFFLLFLKWKVVATVAYSSPRRLATRLQTARPCVAQAGRMLVLRETTSCSSAVTVKVEPPQHTDGWTSSTCCLGGKKSRAALWRVPEKKEVGSSV